MKVVFVSNYFNHYQKALSDAVYCILGSDFVFMETERLDHERKQLGWDEITAPYVIQAWKYAKSSILEMVRCADAVIFGSAPYSLIWERVKKDRLTFAFYERVLKKGTGMKEYLPRCMKYKPLYHGRRNSYLLCAGAYTYQDFSMMGLFQDRAYRWGYFPEFSVKEDISGFIGQKEENSIVWSARYISWKHPEIPVLVAEELRKMGYEFTVTMLGAGEMENQTRELVRRKKLEDSVNICGPKSPWEVREIMDRSWIYLFTSDRSEGWGVVLNESMNSACVPVANHSIGSVPYLVSSGKNGYVYRDGETGRIVEKLIFLMDNGKARRQMQENAYRTIAGLWNPQTAADRLVKMMEAGMEQAPMPVFEKGPCSRARIIRDSPL